MNNAEKGYESEKSFCKELLFRFGVQPIKSTKEEDMFGHWDWKVQDFKYDVKSKASVNRGENAQDKYIWIEFVNVRGRKGWLFGDADFLAFDRGWFWTIVNKQRLIEALSEKVDWSEVLEYGDEKKPYKMYQRKNRQDGVMLVPWLYIMKTEPETWWKKKQ
jgi:hypothetical protein